MQSFTQGLQFWGPSLQEHNRGVLVTRSMHIHMELTSTWGETVCMVQQPARSQSCDMSERCADLNRRTAPPPHPREPESPTRLTNQRNRQTCMRGLPQHCHSLVTADLPPLQSNHSIVLFSQLQAQHSEQAGASFECMW